MDDELTEAPESPQTEAQEQDSPLYGAPATVGILLDPATQPEDVCKHLHDKWEAQREKYARRICEAEVNRRRRSGEGNLWVEKVEDQGRYKVYEPHGSKVNQFYQKANRLCLRAVAVLHPDPPMPDAVPMTGESEDRDAAEFTTRVLRDIVSETGLDQVEAHKQAFDWGSNGGCGYVWYFTDPYGGGRQAIEIEAHPLAETADAALIDPLTGQDYTGETVTKYVRPDGTLTLNRAEAAKQWVPKVTRQVVEFGHVRLHPENAADLWDADALTYAAYHAWGTLKNWFEEIREVSDEDRADAIKFRHKDCDHLLPKRMDKRHDPKPKEGHEDDALALLMIHWCEESADYPDGAYVVTVGNKLVPHRGPWVLETKQGTERRDIPFTQVMQWRGDKDTPTGWGMMDFLGPSNENRGEVTGQVLDMLDKGLNPITFLPLGSTIQPQDLNNPLNATLPIQPGFEPTRFEGPKIPPEAFKLIDMISQDMNDATGMGQASAEGLESSNVQSGRHALAIQSAQQASLSDLNQNINRAFKRAWRIILQCIKADYAIPQLLHYVDKDGSYKAKKWLGSELGSTRDVDIQKGTGTLFNSAQKAQFYGELQQVTQGDPADMRENIASGFSPYIAIQDDDHILRVRRQLAQWEAGPPKGWTPPPPPEPPPQVGFDPMTGEPTFGPPAPPLPYDPVFGADQRLIDKVPLVATKRIRELGNMMSSTKYGTMPPEWRAALDQEFSRMQQALAPPPPPPGAPPPGGKPNAAPPGGPPPLTGAEQAVMGPSVGQPAGAVAP